MLRKMMNKIQKVVVKGEKRVKILIAGVVCAWILSPAYVYAADEEAYMQPLNVIKGILLAICVGYGMINLVMGIMNFSDAYKRRDQGGEKDATSSIIAGGIMVVAPTILALMTS